MKYFCHYCEQPLIPGKHFTLECKCLNCFIELNSLAEVVGFVLFSFEKGKNIVLKKNKYYNKVSYYCNNIELISANVPLQIKDGVPQFYLLYDRLNKLLCFS